MARPYWSGQIRLSLVSFPVDIYTALDRGKHVPLHELYRATKERVRHQNVVEGEPIEREDIVKGYEYEKGSYVVLEPEEIKALKLPSKNILDVVQFVDADAIDPLYFERPYYVVPEGEAGEEAFIVIREALRQSKKVGLGQLVIAGRERLCALKPCGSGMLLEVLRYRDEIRRSDPYFDEIDDIKVDPEQLSLAKELIKRKSGPFKPEAFHDHYREALMELINAKLEDREPEEVVHAPADTKVVNLMDALKKSLGTADKKTTSKKPSKKPAPKKTAAKPKRRAAR